MREGGAAVNGVEEERRGLDLHERNRADEGDRRSGDRHERDDPGGYPEPARGTGYCFRYTTFRVTEPSTSLTVTSVAVHVAVDPTFVSVFMSVADPERTLHVPNVLSL